MGKLIITIDFVSSYKLELGSFTCIKVTEPILSSHSKF